MIGMVPAAWLLSLVQITSIMVMVLCVAPLLLHSVFSQMPPVLINLTSVLLRGPIRQEMIHLQNYQVLVYSVLNTQYASHIE